MENTIKQLLRDLGLKIVDEKVASEYSTYNDCYFVVEGVDGKFIKVDYYADSYGDSVSSLSYKSVTPKPVQKVEYI